MKLFEGKTKSERNKTIAAIVLGGAALIVLFFAFGRGMFSGGKTTVSAKPSPTPKRSTSSDPKSGKPEMPPIDDQMLTMQTQPIVYNRASFYAPDPGRNIFAFYEPPPPCRDCPTPSPKYIPPPPPTPAPTPPIQIAVVNPQSTYAGSSGFRLEIAGDRFTPDTKIYFEQQELPATFVNETRMVADIPSSLISSEGQRTIIAQTTDGTKQSNPVIFDIQPPPKPTFQYIGMIARKRSNNDTAYFKEQGKDLPTGARLNDVVGGRFRVISISADEVVLEDIQLSFSRPRLKLFTPPPGSVPTQPGFPPGRPERGGFPGREVYTPVNPTIPPPAATNSRIPGIPDGVPRYIPPAANSNRMPANTKQQDLDDDDDPNF